MKSARACEGSPDISRERCVHLSGESRYPTTAPAARCCRSSKRPGRASGICLDTGHLNLAGGDPARFVTEAGPWLRALHIADNEGAADQHMLPYGRGTVPWEPFLKALGASGYDGLFNFEIPGETHVPMEIRVAKLRYILEMADYMARIGGFRLER